MSNKPKSMFSVDAAKRHQEQTALTSQLTGAPKPTRKVPMNITLPLEHKNKLVEAAKAKGLSASVIIQMWIDEHCN
jgi:hypothetical protein